MKTEDTGKRRIILRYGRGNGAQSLDSESALNNGGAPHLCQLDACQFADMVQGS